jgi:hypothetical protein
VITCKTPKGISVIALIRNTVYIPKNPFITYVRVKKNTLNNIKYFF